MTHVPKLARQMWIIVEPRTSKRKVGRAAPPFGPVDDAARLLREGAFRPPERGSSFSRAMDKEKTRFRHRTRTSALVGKPTHHAEGENEKSPQVAGER